MSGLILRPDQEEVRTQLRVALRNFMSVLVFAPTGFGKTVLAAKLIELIFGARKRVIFCVHRVDLITQTAKTFERVGIPFSYIAAGYHYNPHHRVYIASIATLKNRLGKIPADYVMVDEAHLSAAAGWTKVAKHYKETGAKLIGLTGSPERLDGKPLGDVWDTMVFGPPVRWLIEQGHLSRYRAFSPAGLDFSGVRKRDGEFVASDIDEIMSGKAVLAGAVRHWKTYCAGMRTIGFTRSIIRAEELAAEFRANGIVAVALDGETPQADRKAAFMGFADRQIELIINCGLFCEGFDLGAQVDQDVTIEAVLDAAPSMSLSRVLQKWGRGLRKKPQPAVLLDLVGGFARHGFPDDEREWSLEGRKNAGREISIMTCPRCFASHGPAKYCPECDFVYPVKARDSLGGGRMLGEVEGQLEEIDVAAIRRNRAYEQSQAQSLDDLVQLAVLRGYKQPEKWAAHVWTGRQAKAGARA